MGHLYIRAQQILSVIPPIRFLSIKTDKDKYIAGMLKHVFSASSVLVYVLIAVTLILVMFYILPDHLLRWSIQRSSQGLVQESSLISDTTIYHQYQVSAEKELELTGKKLNSLIPQKPYIVINTTINTFKLYKAGEIIREGNCSTGSYVKLRSRENKEWIFKTPKGYRTIKYKTTKPVWKKPDWAFVEEGLPVPSPNHPSRFEYGVLGDYALYMGEGYMIHGTLYQRLLGLPVTHGCIRLGDEDLDIVYKNLGAGSAVFII